MEKLSLYTTRLELVPPCSDDVDAIRSACQDPEIQHWVPIPVPYRFEDALEYATVHTEKTWEAGTEFTWTIRFSSQLAGVVGLYRVANSSADLGFWMDPAFRGRGFLTEACREVLDFAFGPAPQGLGLARVGWNAYAGNIGSARVAQSWGSTSRERHGWALPYVENCVMIGRPDYCSPMIAVPRTGRSSINAHKRVGTRHRIPTRLYIRLPLVRGAR